MFYIKTDTIKTGITIEDMPDHPGEWIDVDLEVGFVYQPREPEVGIWCPQWEYEHHDVTGVTVSQGLQGADVDAIVEERVEAWIEDERWRD